MRLPNFDKAIIPKAKLTEYLLSLSHPDGYGKAKFFMGLGFSPETWEVLAETLLRHAAECEVTKIESSPFGTRYVIEGVIVTPKGRMPLIRSVWFVETGEQIPRFATAYPLPGR